MYVCRFEPDNGIEILFADLLAEVCRSIRNRSSHPGPSVVEHVLVGIPTTANTRFVLARL